MKLRALLLIIAVLCGSTVYPVNTTHAQNTPTGSIIRVPRSIRNEYIVVLKDDVPVWAIDMHLSKNNLV